MKMKEIRRGKKGSSCLLETHKPKEVNSRGYLESLKYKIKAMTTTRTAIMEPIIHLFLLILLDMLVKIFLLLLTLSSTPCSCNTRMKTLKQR